MPRDGFDGREAETLQDWEHRGQFHPAAADAAHAKIARCSLAAPGQDQAVALGSQAGHLEPVSSGVGWCRLLLIARGQAGQEGVGAGPHHVHVRVPSTSHVRGSGQ